MRVLACPCVRVCACPRVRVSAGVLPAGADVWLSVRRPPRRACQPVPGSAVSGVASWIAWIHSLGLEKSWEHAGGGSALLQGRPCCASGGQVLQETASRTSHGARSRSRSPWRCRRKSSVSDSMSHPAQCRPHRAVIFILAEQTRQAARHSTCPPSLFSKVTGSVDPGRTSLQSPHVPHPSPPCRLLALASSLRHTGINPRLGAPMKRIWVCVYLSVVPGPTASASTSPGGLLASADPGPQPGPAVTVSLGCRNEVAETRILRPEVQRQGASVVGFW